nr:ATP-binding protein [Candidatus Poribacteria bacterium]
MSTTMDLHHSIDAKHAQNIGEQSVSDRVQAVIEIVKNSYDADALNCTVRFFARSGGSGTLVHIDKIVISDDGMGMTLGDIKNKWMRLATDSKIKDNKSPKFGRTVSGQKGMGHFATQKLGSKIVLISNPELSNTNWFNSDYRKSSDDYDKTLVLSTDWDTYTPGKSFDEIPNRLVIEPRNDELNQKLYACKYGLTIEITNLKEDWTLKDVEKVQRHLGALQIPKFLKSSEKNVFNAEVKTDGFNI